MVIDREIYASAKIFIDQHGDDALIEAMKKIAIFEAKGDYKGRACWNEIANAIEWIQMPTDLTGEQYH